MTSRLRIFILILVMTSLASAYLVSNSSVIRKAWATGGAFNDTKHGGGDVDPTKWFCTTCGVDRELGGEVFYYYDDPSAGKYEVGECNHCHEPHASFGATDATLVEPPPNTGADAGPDVYLLMKEYGSGTPRQYSELCWYCHEGMTLGFPPRDTGYGWWGFYQGQNVYQSSSHYNSSSFEWPGTGGSDVFPREDRSSAVTPAGNEGSCLNCHSPHGVSGTMDTGASITSGDYNADTPSASSLIPRQLIAREEALCLRCHDGSPAGTDIKAEVDEHPDAGGTGSGHPVRSATTYGVHDLANEDMDTVAPGWFGANPHAECTDCHNPHVATSGVAFGRADVLSPALLGGVNEGVWGVTITTTTGAHVGTKMLDSSTDYAYQLCLKCHSAWGIGANSPGSSSLSETYNGVTLSTNGADVLTDVASEFATNNLGYHPVYGVGRNMPSVNANGNWPATPDAGSTGDQTCLDINGVLKTSGLGHNFVAPWGPCSIVTCVDCHRYGDGTVGADGTEPEGPHGSANNWILRDVATNSFTDGNTDNYICYNCHRWDIYGGPGDTGPNNDNYSRADGHPAPGNNSEASDTKNFYVIACLTCHGGQYPGSIHGSTSTAIQPGSNITLDGDEAPYVMRLRNGAGVPTQKIQGVNGAAETACYSVTVTTALFPANACTQNHSTDQGVTTNYTYSGNP